jgi:glutamate synthase (NADPH/NADH) large chain
MKEPHQHRDNFPLYDPRNEHDACGIGFIVNIKGERSHDIIT